MIDYDYVIVIPGDQVPYIMSSIGYYITTTGSQMNALKNVGVQISLVYNVSVIT